MAYCALKAISGKGGAGAPKAPPLDMPLNMNKRLLIIIISVVHVTNWGLVEMNIVKVTRYV